MLCAMWVLPLLAAAVALVFAGQLARQWMARRRPYQLLWSLAMAMYALASVAVAVGVLRGWTVFDFRVYWALGAVLNVPFLAAGELELLVRNRTVHLIVDLLLVFLVAFVVAVLRHAPIHAEALLQRLPSGKHVFGDGTPAHRLPQLISIPSYVVLARRGALVGLEDARTPGAEGPVRRDAADRPWGDDRGRGSDFRGLRQPAGFLPHTGGGDHRDVRRVPEGIEAGACARARDGRTSAAETGLSS